MTGTSVRCILGFDPAGKTVEVTKFPQALALFKASNVTIRDVGFRRYASNQYGGATSGALLLNAGKDVTLDGVVVTQSAGNGSVGLEHQEPDGAFRRGCRTTVSAG